MTAQRVALPIYQVDAFTSRLFAGNPAAVCPLEAWLEEPVMQAIAAENNLSETAFLVPRGDDFELRWFTPAIEVDLCGHATLASGFVVLAELRPGAEAVSFHTREAGVLTVARAGARDGARGDDRYRMTLPARPPRPIEPPDGMAAALGVEPTAVLEATKLMAVLESAEAVLAVTPDLGWIAAQPRDGLIITAAGDGDIDFVSRYFAPHAGIDEDPVTGSAHCTLAPYWAGELGKVRLEARQVSARGGALSCEVERRAGGDRVHLIGSAVLYLRGEIELPG